MSKLTLSVQYAYRPPIVPDRYAFRRWIKAALQPDVALAEITIRIVDAEEGQALNHTYRHKDSATNVLTFTYDEPSDRLLGDIVLCAPVVEKEAQPNGLIAHYAHLTVHGVLHLQGYDHMTDVEAGVMEPMEAQILQTLGYKNPY
jgi:probable rRNA maturation factor